MLDAAKRGEFDVLVVPDPDRFSRDMAKQLILEEEPRRSGVTIRYICLPLDDSAEAPAARLGVSRAPRAHPFHASRI